MIDINVLVISQYILSSLAKYSYAFNFLQLFIDLI